VRPLLPSGRFSVIPNWVAGAAGAPIHSQDAHAIRVLYVGRMERYKGAHLLLEATRSMPGLEITLAGDGAYRAELEVMAQGRTDVRFAGFVKDVRSLYDDADVVVMPSMGPEGLPMTCLEAMAHGVPCVFSDLGVHREISNDGEGALLFRSGDAADLRRALERLIQDPALGPSLSRSAMRIIHDRYTESSARGPYLSVLSMEGAAP
jgi:glycosyltransferase involved in cell wall biosynthesis